MTRPPKYYTQLFDHLELLPSRLAEIAADAEALLQDRDRYDTPPLRMLAPWYVIGVIHRREASADPSRQILNGEKWNRETVGVPVRQGPWKSWEDSTVAALTRDYPVLPKVWTVETIGKFLEQWNGGGYMRRSKHSPYLWAGSTAGLGVGKYVADGKYDPLAVDQQNGAMVVLWLLERMKMLEVPR